LFFVSFYPFVSKKRKKRRYFVALGAGGNIGNVKLNFKKLFLILKRNRNISILASSPILKNPPVGYKNQPDFLNAVILISASIKPTKMLKFLQKIEKQFHRKRSFKNAPRTLDLDILYYKNIRVNMPYLKLPHPEMSKRIFVMLPLKLIEGIA